MENCEKILENQNQPNLLDSKYLYRNDKKSTKELIKVENTMSDIRVKEENEKKEDEQLMV